MKKIALMAAVSAAVTASPALADSKDYPVTASVAASCTAQTGSTTELDFGTLTTGADGKMDSSYASTSKSFTQSSFVCNGGATTISASATAMTTATAPTNAAFTGTINYSVDVSLGSYSDSFDTTGAGISGATLGEQSGTLSVTAKNLAPAGGLPLFAGDYSGAITVTITPSA